MVEYREAKVRWPNRDAEGWYGFAARAARKDRPGFREGLLDGQSPVCRCGGVSLWSAGWPWKLERRDCDWAKNLDASRVESNQFACYSVPPWSRILTFREHGSGPFGSGCWASLEKRNWRCWVVLSVVRLTVAWGGGDDVRKSRVDASAERQQRW